MCRYQLTRTSPARPCHAADYVKRFSRDDLPVAKILDKQFPIDASGLCIFHSMDIDWKLENDFHLWLDLLLAYIGQLDNVTYMMTQPPMLKEVSFAGFYLIGEEYELAGGSTQVELRIKGLKFKDNILWSWMESEVVDPLYFEDFEADKTEINFGHALIQGEFHLNKVQLAQISFNDAKIQGGLLASDCEFSKYAEFGGLSVGNICNFQKVHFSTNAYFNAGIFACESILLDSCSFLGKTEFIGCDFRGDFSIENCEFEKELNFTNAKFSCTADFTGNYYHDNVLFVSTEAANKLFYDSVNFLFLNKEEEVQGRIIFDNVNYSNILKEGHQELSELERLNKVRIGAGCIKYRQQTPPRTIKTDNINANIAKELANSFSNYFTSSSGMNLGVEFINKSLHSLSLFYFTDEDISHEEFTLRLQSAEETYWDFNVKDVKELSEVEIAQQIDSYVSKIALLTKMAMLREQGLWRDKQTNNVLKVIHFSEAAPDAVQINMTINNFVDNRKTTNNNMKIGKVIAKKGSQVNFADVIEKVEFNPGKVSVSKEEFKQLQELLISLADDEVQDIQVLVDNPVQSPNVYERLREKLDEFAIKHGTPLFQGISASVIYDALKYLLSQ